MSKVPMLRALLNERLTGAANEVSALERASTEYDEELCRFGEKNQRKQRLLDQALSRRVLLNQGLNQDFTETPWIKEEPEEQSVTQEEEQLPVPVPESGAVRAKTEESSELQQRQTEHREETQGEDISSEPHFHSETERHTDHSSDTDDSWEPPFSWSVAQMETDADGDHNNEVKSRERRTKLSPNKSAETTDHNYSRVQRRDRSTKLSPNKSAPESTVRNEDKSGPDRAGKKHQCSVCEKSFGENWILQRHIRVHTGERPYNCSTCDKAFAQLSSLIKHRRTHTGEKPYSCSTCNKAFTQRSHLKQHTRMHTGQK